MPVEHVVVEVGRETPLRSGSAARQRAERRRKKRVSNATGRNGS
jgi:hypothetical protein